MRVLLVVFVIGAFVAMSRFFFRMTRKTCPGFDLWTTGVGLLSLGYFFLCLRGYMPDPIFNSRGKYGLSRSRGDASRRNEAFLETTLHIAAMGPWLQWDLLRLQLYSIGKGNRVLVSCAKWRLGTE